MDPLAVDANAVGGGIRTRPELRHHFTVHRNPAFRDDLFRFASRGDALMRENFLKTFLHSTLSVAGLPLHARHWGM